MTKVKDDKPSDSRRNATLNRNTDRRGYIKHNIDVKKHMNTDNVARDMDAMYKNILTSPITFIILYSRGEVENTDAQCLYTRHHGHQRILVCMELFPTRLLGLTGCGVLTPFLFFIFLYILEETHHISVFADYESLYNLY